MGKVGAPLLPQACTALYTTPTHLLAPVARAPMQLLNSTQPEVHHVSCTTAGGGHKPAAVVLDDLVVTSILVHRFPGVSGSDPNGNPNTHLPQEVLDSIRRNGVCFKGTLFTPLTKYNTSTQSLNVQLRKQLDLQVNLVHGFTVPGLPTRHDNIDIVVIRCGSSRDETSMQML